MSDGSYSVSFTGYDADGEKMLVETTSNGIVTGVETSQDGNHKLYLDDGRTVNFNEVALITLPKQSTPTPEEPGDDGNGDGEYQ